MSSDEEPLNGLISKTRECRNENYKIAIINYVSLHLLFNLGVDRDPESFCWYLLEAGTFLRLSSSCYHDYQCCLSYTSVRIDFLVHYRILGSWLLVNHFLVLVVYPIFSHLQTQLLCYLSIFLAVSLFPVSDKGNQYYLYDYRVPPNEFLSHQMQHGFPFRRLPNLRHSLHVADFACTNTLVSRCHRYQNCYGP